MDFENLLCEYKRAVERFVYYRITNKEDADDILQEIYLTAFRKFPFLRNEESFKAWLISIARNKCNDYYRMSAKMPYTSDFKLNEITFARSIYGITEKSDVEDTLNVLKTNEKQILYFYYFLELSQKEIAQRLNIPLGTVKSRLYNAKQNFKANYPYSYAMKGDNSMKLPEFLPNYKIVKVDKEPFSVVWKELMGHFIVPQLGEKISWALYDFPERKCTEYAELEVIGNAEVHGIEGVEIIEKEYNPVACNQLDNYTFAERRFVAQLTDTHCRILAESHKKDGVNRLYTFLDGDSFLNNWGFGDDNCGKEINISKMNRISKNGSIIECDGKPYCMDIVGRYTVTIGNREFDTICLMDIETYDNGIVTEQFIDKNGKTILWRRFNADDWAFSSYQMRWSERLPDNEQITVNGKIYVHWYDCISDYIL